MVTVPTLESAVAVDDAVAVDTVEELVLPVLVTDAVEDTDEDD